MLCRAVEDALVINDWVEARRAIAWFESKNEDFVKVCHWANRDPEYVYEKMKIKIRERKKSIIETRQKYGGRFPKIVYRFKKGKWVNENIYQPQGDLSPMQR